MRNRKVFNNYRLIFLLTCAFIAGFIIMLRLISIQLISHQSYNSQAENNRTQILYQTAPRGQILTSDGEIIASNQASFALYYLPPAKKPSQEELSSLAQAVAKNLEGEEEQVLKMLNQSLKSGKAILLADNLAPKNIFPLAELQNLYTGLYLLEESKRYYPKGSFASHLLGYIGTMEKSTWRKLSGKLDYRLDSKIGKSGIEKRYEKELKGRDGGLFLEVNYKGRINKIIKEIIKIRD